jgi:Carbamoyl-phosphate synthase small chain, CPSase domain
MFPFLNTVKRPWKTSDARLVLEDGSIWRAKSFGATGTQVGEVVFNTSLTGYFCFLLFVFISATWYLANFSWFAKCRIE